MVLVVLGSVEDEPMAGGAGVVFERNLVVNRFKRLEDAAGLGVSAGAWWASDGRGGSAVSLNGMVVAASTGGGVGEGLCLVRVRQSENEYEKRCLCQF